MKRFLVGMLFGMMIGIFGLTMYEEFSAPFKVGDCVRKFGYRYSGTVTAIKGIKVEYIVWSSDFQKINYDWERAEDLIKVECLK